MLNSYFKIVFRNISRNKLYSIINVLGLSLGFAAFMLICQFVTLELSFDKFHSKSDRIFRIVNDRYQNGKLVQHSTYSYPAVSPAMTRDYPEIETYTRLLVPGGETIIKAGNEVFLGDRSLFVDEKFLTVFDFPLIVGDRVSALSEKRAVVISEQMARKYFQEGDLTKLIGKELYWSTESPPYVVKGICANVPANSHVQFDILLSYSTLYSAGHKDPDESWTWSNVRHYLLLKPGADHNRLDSKFAAFSERYFQGDKVTESVEKFFLQPLGDVHLNSDHEYEYAVTANGKTCGRCFRSLSSFF